MPVIAGVISGHYRGTQWEILRKRPKNNNKAWIKVSEAILSILGDCWEKFICSSLLARLMEELRPSKMQLQPATWLNGKFPSRRMSITGQFGCGHRQKFAPLVEGVGERFRTNSKYTLSCLLPATLLFQISQLAKVCLKNRYFEEQILWVPLSLRMVTEYCYWVFLNSLILNLLGWQWWWLSWIKNNALAVYRGR